MAKMLARCVFTVWLELRREGARCSRFVRADSLYEFRFLKLQLYDAGMHIALRFVHAVNSQPAATGTRRNSYSWGGKARCLREKMAVILTTHLASMRPQR